MKENWKSFLKSIHLYHPLQSMYSRGRSFILNRYHQITYRRYKGSGYTCNFCGASYLKMVPEHPGPDIQNALTTNQVIAGYGDNVYCPDCGSKNRERLVKAVISGYLTIHKRKILHMSPEKHLSEWIRQFAEVTSVDLYPGFYRHIDKTTSYADATRLPFRNGSFDMVIANHILEHIPDDQQAMREIYRVLKKDGTAILQVPYSSFLPATIEYPSLRDPAKQAALFGQKDHVRIYSLNDYVMRLIHAGFRIRILTPSELAPYRRYAIQETESVFLCHK